MSQVPSKFTPRTSFSSLAQQPITSTGLPGAEIDAELTRAGESINTVIDRLAEIQRDDGKLREGIVDMRSLDPAFIMQLVAKGMNPVQWFPLTYFRKGDVVSDPASHGTILIKGALSYQASAGGPFINFSIPELVRWNSANMDPSTGMMIPSYSQTPNVLTPYRCIYTPGTGGGSGWRIHTPFGTFRGVVYQRPQEPINVDAWYPISVGYPQVFGFPVIQPSENQVLGAFICIRDHLSNANFSETINHWVQVAAKPEAGSLALDSFTADGLQTAFYLSTVPIEEVNTQVFVAGLYQAKSAYNLSGNTLTFLEAPASGSLVEIVSGIPSQTLVPVVADNSITDSKLAIGSVTTGKIVDGGVTGQKIAAEAIGTENIADGAITTAKLANGSIGSDKIASQSIQGGHVENGAITTVKLGDNSVNSNKLANGSVSSLKLADGPISLKGKYTPTEAAHIVTKDFLERGGSVVSGMIANGAVTASKIADGSIFASKIAATGNFPIKVSQSTKAGGQTIAGTGGSGWTDVTNLDITFARVKTTSNLRVQAVIQCATNNAHNGIAFRLVRNSTPMFTGGTAGNRTEVSAVGGANCGNNGITTAYIDFIDTLSGISATNVSYKIQAKCANGVTGYVNRSSSDPDTADAGFRAASSITVTELSN